MKSTTETRTITLFNKNGIAIKKCPWRDISANGVSYPHIGGDVPIVYYLQSEIKSAQNPQDPYRYFTKSKKAKKALVKKESPLGFYYWVESTENAPELSDTYAISKRIVTVVFQMNLEWCYFITYLSEKNGTIVDKETRPWDLVGSSFPDNYVNSLLAETNKLFDEFESFKNKAGYLDETYLRYECGITQKDHMTDPHSLRRRVINDLFGDPEGIKFQTNDEKILAHGFDLKTSFRKM